MTNTFKIGEVQVAPGFVIVKPQATETASGIYTPKKEQEVPQWGEIVSVGERPDAKTFYIAVGQTVIYKQWGGNKVEVGGHKYYFLKYDEIIGAIK